MNFNQQLYSNNSAFQNNLTQNSFNAFGAGAAPALQTNTLQNGFGFG